MRLFFWVCVALIIYHFLVYPGIVWILARIIPRPVKKKEVFPKVSLVIPIYNEENIAEEKILNSLNLDYPKEKLEILFASDGSDDGTEDIIKRYSDKGIRLFANPENTGKTELINRAVPRAEGEIVVLSDASGILNRGSIREMVKNFNDPEVGCVCGIYRISSRDKSQVDEFEERYFDFETALKINESLIYTTLGGPGAIYAIRKNLFRPLERDLINEDFLVSSNVVMQGFRTVYEEKALLHDRISTALKDEFRRRIRIGAGNWQQAFLMKDFLKTKRYFIIWQLLSHKILRTFVPFPLIFILAGSMYLDGLIYRIILTMSMSFISLASIGWILHRKKISNALFYVPFYICIGSLAYLVGTYKILFAKERIKW
ncbi:glycosyltransferase family 2 protein [Candidatus Omnitrophota bacterium]